MRAILVGGVIGLHLIQKLVASITESHSFLPSSGMEKKCQRLLGPGLGIGDGGNDRLGTVRNEGWRRIRDIGPGRRHRFDNRGRRYRRERSILRPGSGRNGLRGGGLGLGCRRKNRRRWNHRGDWRRLDNGRLGCRRHDWLLGRSVGFIVAASQRRESGRRSRFRWDFILRRTVGRSGRGAAKDHFHGLRRQNFTKPFLQGAWRQHCGAGGHQHS